MTQSQPIVEEEADDDDRAAGPEPPPDEEVLDDEDGRFFGGGITRDTAEVLDFMDEWDNEGFRVSKNSMYLFKLIVIDCYCQSLRRSTPLGYGSLP